MLRARHMSAANFSEEVDACVLDSCYCNSNRLELNWSDLHGPFQSTSVQSVRCKQGLTLLVCEYMRRSIQLNDVYKTFIIYL